MFHMDLLPQLPQNVLFQMLTYIKLEETMLPIDLSSVNKQIDSYVPLTTRIEDGKTIKSILLKLLFLSTFLLSIFYFLSFY